MLVVREEVMQTFKWALSGLGRLILITIITPIISCIGVFAVIIPMELLRIPSLIYRIIGAIIFVVSAPFIFFKLGKMVRLWGDWSE